jgi:hypothetical protein
MIRIYHHYLKWEDWRFGFYDNCSGEVKNEKIERVLEMFNSEELTRKYMSKVISEWKYSCEHNLTNDSLNKIAYIGQAACCLFAEVPGTVTMEAWSLLTPEVQDRSDKIALEILNKWESENNNIQLCLKLD